MEGDIDLRGLLGLESKVPKGFTNVRIGFKAKAGVNNMERLKRLTAFSPALNTITQGVRGETKVEPK